MSVEGCDSEEERSKRTGRGIGRSTWDEKHAIATT